MNIHLNSFIGRQTPDSRFGHWDMEDDELVRLIADNFENRKPGYREGVILVPVPPANFFSSTVPLREGMLLTASYAARRPGETPRMHVGATVGGMAGDYRSAKSPAVACDIVLYASTVLAEDGDNELPAEPGDWEVVSVNPRMCLEEEPINPEALIANHLQESGGTATLMTDSEFVAALRVSRAYWNHHVTLG